MTTIARACREIDQLARAAEASDRFLDLHMDLGELARENDELKAALGRQEDRRP